ncbi:MAG: SGNH/GDSL hydrolase family protein [Gammaproteobacteria bacterium]
MKTRLSPTAKRTGLAFAVSSFLLFAAFAAYYVRGGDNILSRSSWLWPVTSCALAYLSALAIWGLSSEVVQDWSKGVRRVASVTVHVLAVLVLLESSAWVLLSHASRHDTVSYKPYKTFFDTPLKEKESEYTWNLLGKALYINHHYLNYALNPYISYHGAKQFNERYLIRRSEAVRPKDQVEFRALVLGGSTTFDTQIDEESRTWVYRLEELARTKYGDDIDVINAGVGGYTAAENFIHYFTLLHDLEPDLLVLYVGINDVWPRLVPTLKPDYRHYRSPFVGVVFTPLVPKLKPLGIYRYYYYRRRIVPQLAGGVNSLAAGGAPEIKDTSKMLELLRENPATYFERYLVHFIAAVKATGKEVLILPQYYRPHLNDFTKGFGAGVEEHNDLAREVAQTFELRFAESILRETTFAPGDVNDDCHFNAVGANKMASAVFVHLQDYIERRGIQSRNQISGEVKDDLDTRG